LKTSTLNISLLPENEREKIQTFDVFEKTGLYGQFPHHALTYQHWRGSFVDLFKESEDNVVTILDADEFKGFRRYSEGPCCCVRAATSLDLLISGKVGLTQCTVIWSIQQHNINHHLMLVLIDRKLKLCTAEYAHRNEHMATGVHWYKILSDLEVSEVDSYRFHQVLTVLSNPKSAWEYLRARVHSIEISYRG